MADLSCILVRLRARKARIPMYSEITAKSNGTYDSRSGREIVDSIIAKRKKARAERGGEKT